MSLAGCPIAISEHLTLDAERAREGPWSLGSPGSMKRRPSQSNCSTRYPATPDSRPCQSSRAFESCDRTLLLARLNPASRRA